MNLSVSYVPALMAFGCRTLARRRLIALSKNNNGLIDCLGCEP
jgi:hypothetical protein